MNKIVFAGKPSQQSLAHVIKIVLGAILVVNAASSCRSVPTETSQPLPTHTSEPTPMVTSPPTSTPEPTPTVTSPPPTTPIPTPSSFHHWQDIVPGESSKSDVLDSFGPPDQEYTEGLPNQESKVERRRALVWVYESFEGKMPGICANPCEGWGKVYMIDRTVLMIELLIFKQQPTVGELVAVLGEPELDGGSRGTPSHSREVPVLEDKGIDWRNMVREWDYVYSTSGVYARVGPKYEGEGLGVSVYYPKNSVPPDDVPITAMFLFPPMSLDEYYESPFIFLRVKLRYPE